MKSSNADFAAALIACALALLALAESAATPAANVARSVAPGPAPAHVRELLAGETLELNSADAADLRLLPGVGPKLADRIVAERVRRGGFGRVDDLRSVKGVGPATLARLRPWLRVSGPVSDRTATPRSP